MNGQMVATPAFATEQLDDLATLLAREGRGTVSWLAAALLGRGVIHEAGDHIGDVHEFARRMVEALHAAGRVPEAIAQLREEAHPNGRLALGLSHILAGRRIDDDAAFQQFVNEYEPFLSVAGFEELFPRIRRTVCAVGLGRPINQIVGSGFLVGPDLVMTNFHVIEPFLEVQPGGKVVATGPGEQLYCFFDYLSEPAPQVPPGDVKHASLAVQAAADWLVAARVSLPADGKRQAPRTVDKEYDYAVIRLSKRVGERPPRLSGGGIRGWLALPDRIEVLEQPRRVLIFQHPGAERQLWDIGDFVQMDPSRTRLWYSVSTAKGSSGGAAVDTDGQLFALHNAEVEERVPGVGKTVNQGVRIDLIAQDLPTVAAAWNQMIAPQNDPLAFWSLNDDPLDPQPVIGRTRFREIARTMRRSETDRVAVVIGPPGSGLQFSIKLLRRTLGVQVPVAVLSPKDLQTLTPESFVRTVIQDLGVTGDGTSMPARPATENLSRWRRLDLPRWLQAQLAADAARDPSRFPGWIVINAVTPSGERLLWADQLKDLVAALVGVRDPTQEAVDLPQLRWLFLGLNRDPFPLAGLRAQEEVLNDADSYQQDFAECMQRAWRAVQKQDPPSDEFLFKWARSTKKQHDALNEQERLRPGGRQLSLRKALATIVRDQVVDDAGE